jgi:hypothetical protein
MHVRPGRLIRHSVVNLLGLWLSGAGNREFNQALYMIPLSNERYVERGAADVAQELEKDTLGAATKFTTA